MADLKASQLACHLFAGPLVALLVEMEPRTELFGIQGEYLAYPTEASRMVLIREEPFQGIVSPDFPFLVGRLFGRDNISEGLKQNAQGKIPQRGIWLLGLRIEAFAFDH